MTPLNFAAERDAGTDSWTRADPDAALVEHVTGATWRVLLPGGSTHLVTFRSERGAFAGTCDCKGFEFGANGSPCAHLCTLRQAEFGRIADDRGRPIVARDHDADAPTAHREPVTDGGSPRESRSDHLAGRADEVIRP